MLNNHRLLAGRLALIFCVLGVTSLGNFAVAAEDSVMHEIHAAEDKLLERRTGEAVDRLQAIKSRHFPEGQFPGQLDLAHALYAERHFDDAEEAYGEIVGESSYSADVRREAVAGLRSLHRDLSGQVEVDGFFTNVDEGEAYRLTEHLRSPEWNDWRLWAWGRHDFIRLDGDTVLRDRNSNRHEGGVSLERQLGNKANGAVGVGGSEDDFLFGAELNLRGRRGLSLGLELDINERAVDTLTVEALDGRQHKLQLQAGIPITPRIFLDVSAYLREVTLLDDEVGEGWGTEVTLDYTVVSAKRVRPALRIGYAGEVHIFDRDTVGSEISRFTRAPLSADERRDLSCELFEEEVNLHGPRVSIGGRWDDRLACSVEAAAQYDFFDEEFQPRAGLGFEWYLNDRIRLSGRADYLANGQAANRDSEEFRANLGVSLAF